MRRSGSSAASVAHSGSTSNSASPLRADRVRMYSPRCVQSIPSTGSCATGTPVVVDVHHPSAVIQCSTRDGPEPPPGAGITTPATDPYPTRGSRAPGPSCPDLDAAATSARRQGGRAAGDGRATYAATHSRQIVARPSGMRSAGGTGIWASRYAVRGSASDLVGAMAIVRSPAKWLTSFHVCGPPSQHNPGVHTGVARQAMES
jgi:hypothetical protein